MQNNNINKSIPNNIFNNNIFYYKWSYYFINYFQLYIEGAVDLLIELIEEVIVDYNEKGNYTKYYYKDTTTNFDIECMHYINNNIVNNSKLSVEEKNQELLNYFYNNLLIKA